jgi:deoxyribose-phosphate aldolase
MNHSISKKIADLIDYTLLTKDANGEDHIKLCRTAKKWGFRTVCVYPNFVELCAEQLEGTSIEVCTVVDFPNGEGDITNNVVDVAMAASDGAMEIDMVMDIEAFRQKDYEKVSAGIINIIEAAEGRIIKVIIESCLWTDEEIKIACEVVQGSSAQFVKSSTGFSTHGATIDHIRIMRETVGDLFGVKASSGIKSFDDALKMIQAGANRIGTSSGDEIMKTEKLKSED